MIFPTFFLDIKNIEYTMSRDGLSLYTLIKNKGSYSESKKCFSILMENRKIRFKLCKLDENDMNRIKGRVYHGVHHGD